jgi:hypothetical protein
LLLLKTSKKFSDLLKLPELANKFSNLLLMAIILCKKSILKTEFLLRTLQKGTDIFLLPGYELFLVSNLRGKFITEFMEDLNRANVLLKSLENKLLDPTYSTGIDNYTLSNVCEKAPQETFLDKANEGILIHILKWRASQFSYLSKNASRALLIAAVFDHICLNLQTEVPVYRNGKLFNIGEFFERVENMNEGEAQDQLAKYSMKKDPMGSLCLSQMIKAACCSK